MHSTSKTCRITLRVTAMHNQSLESSAKLVANLIEAYLLPTVLNEWHIQLNLPLKADQFVPFKFGNVQSPNILYTLGGAKSPNSFRKAHKKNERRRLIYPKKLSHIGTRLKKLFRINYQFAAFLRRSIKKMNFWYSQFTTESALKRTEIFRSTTSLHSKEKSRKGKNQTLNFFAVVEKNNFQVRKRWRKLLHFITIRVFTYKNSDVFYPIKPIYVCKYPSNQNFIHSERRTETCWQDIAETWLVDI